MLILPIQAQEPDWALTFERMLGAGLEVSTLLLTCTLAVFILLVFLVRVLMIVRKLPVPSDPVDMARPTAFRALMLGSSALLAPLVALDFFPVDGLDPRAVLAIAYGFEVLIAVAGWFALHLFYKTRSQH
jgi:hypothetical protein